MKNTIIYSFFFLSGICLSSISENNNMNNVDVFLTTSNFMYGDTLTVYKKAGSKVNKLLYNNKKYYFNNNIVKIPLYSRLRSDINFYDNEKFLYSRVIQVHSNLFSVRHVNDYLEINKENKVTITPSFYYLNNLVEIKTNLPNTILKKQDFLYIITAKAKKVEILFTNKFTGEEIQKTEYFAK